MSDEHYLKKELYRLIKTDDSIFEFMQTGSLDGIWYWDLETQADEWMSPRFWTLLGYDPAEMKHLASEWQDIIFKEDLETALDNFQKHCADPNHPYDQIVRYRHRDGSTVWVRCRGIVIRDDDGKPVRMLGAHTDLTALKQAEEERDRLIDDLERFGHMVSHDLKSPLTTLSFYTSSMAKNCMDIMPEKEAKHLAKMPEIIEQMETLISSLLAFAKSGGLAMVTEPVSLKSVIEQVLLENDAVINETGAEVRTNLAEDMVQADRNALLRIMSNLMSNALKYHIDKPNITIASAGLDDEEVIITFSDKGPGVSEELQDRIFNEFERGEGDKIADGTGVGLAIVKRFVQAMDGTICIDSEDDVGTTITLTLHRVTEQ